MMGFRNPARDREAQPGTAAIVLRARSRLISTKEPLEDARLQLRRNTRPGVGNAQRVFPAFAAASHRDAAAFRRVFYGIVQEVEDHPAKQSLVRVDRQFLRGIAVERDAFRKSECARRMGAVSNELIQVKVVR